MTRKEYLGAELIIEFIFDGKPFRPFAFSRVEDGGLHECDNPCCDSYTDDMCRTLIDNQLGEAYLRSINSMGIREVEYNTWQSIRFRANAWRKIAAMLREI